MGLTDDEFWRSTLAKVNAIYEVKRLQWDKSRDYLLSQVISNQVNRYCRSENSDKIWSPDDFMPSLYARRKGKDQSVMITSESGAERGAQGNWKELKAGMKGITEKNKAKRAKLKPRIPKA